MVGKRLVRSGIRFEKVVTAIPPYKKRPILMGVIKSTWLFYFKNKNLKRTTPKGLNVKRSNERSEIIAPGGTWGS